MTQLALQAVETKPKPGMTCNRPLQTTPNPIRCGSRVFGIFPGPTGNRLRCRQCGQAAVYAICDCQHGMQAHMSHGGCEAATDSGEPCECEARRPR